MDNKGTGSQWILGKYLEDVEYAYDLALLSYADNHIDEKNQCLEVVAASVGLRINKDKTKLQLGWITYILDYMCECM